MSVSPFVDDAGAIERFESRREQEARAKQERREERDRRNQETAQRAQLEWAAERDDLERARDTARRDVGLTRRLPFLPDDLPQDTRDRLEAAIYRVAADHLLADAEAAYEQHTTRIR